jgi:glycosyltransferase involved in cell wall biosynthesis
VAAANIGIHKRLRTWVNKVDVFIALTEFARSKFIEGGIPARKLHVKPSFAHQAATENRRIGSYFLYVGRISKEKGVPTLIRVWKNLAGIPLKIAGQGPLSVGLGSPNGKKYSPNIELLGMVNHQEIADLMNGAFMLLFPSECREMLPQVLLEAMACGLPVIARRQDATEQLLQDQHTGFFFCDQSESSLEKVVRFAWNHPELVQQMSKNLMIEHQKHSTNSSGHEELLRCYDAASQNREKNRLFDSSWVHNSPEKTADIEIPVK